MYPWSHKFHLSCLCDWIDTLRYWIDDHYNWMTLKVRVWMWYNVSSIPIWIESSMKVRMTRDTTYKLGVYKLETWFNMRTVTRAAIEFAVYWASSLHIMDLLSIHTAVKHCYWNNHSTSLSVLDNHFAGIQLARTLNYWLYDESLPSLSAAQRHKSTYNSQCRNHVVQLPSWWLQWSV